jgi:hypothetical protein
VDVGRVLAQRVDGHGRGPYTAPVPALSLPPRFWALVGVVFFGLFAWRVTRRWWASWKRDMRTGWDALRDRGR